MASGGIEYTRLVLSITKAARWRRQYSSIFTVPSRLCSTSCRLDVRPSMPASTLGLAAASSTTSTAGSVSKIRRATDVGVVDAHAQSP